MLDDDEINTTRIVSSNRGNQMKLDEQAIILDNPRVYLPFTELLFKKGTCMCGKHEVPSIIVKGGKDTEVAVIMPSKDEYNRIKKQYEKNSQL